MTISIRIGDCRDVLRTLPDESVHCVVTSPPYWGLRDYGVGGQLGLEPDFRDYVAAMVAVFREVRHVLRKDGTLWLNLGDSYAGSWGNQGRKEERGTQRAINGGMLTPVFDGRYPDKNNNTGKIPEGSGLKPKDLVGIPWRVAFALQEDGWYLRQDIIWSKPNPMPESVTDRCTKSHEYLFLLSKSARYYYDAGAIAEPVTQSTIERVSQPTLQQQEGSWRVPGKTNGSMKAVDHGPTRNRRSVWEVATQPFSEAHFATFPPALIEPCIKAGTSEKGCCGKCGAPWRRESERAEPSYWEQRKNHDFSGRKTNAYSSNITIGWSPSCKCDAAVVPCTVLDPFGGAGTTGLVADRLQRSAILIELNPTYADMSQRRIKDDAPLFAAVNDYNATDDFAKSIDEAYRVIRERKAAGGKGWTPP
jgi:DNA modification methylase